MLPLALLQCRSSRGEVTYHSNLRRGDDIRVIVARGFESPLHCDVRVTRVVWHGHYSIIRGWRYVGAKEIPVRQSWEMGPRQSLRQTLVEMLNWRPVRFRLWRDGPKDRGVLSCRVMVRRSHQPEPTSRCVELNDATSVTKKLRQMACNPWKERTDRYVERRRQARDRAVMQGSGRRTARATAGR